MGAVVALDALIEARRVWRGRPSAPPASSQPTGHAALDAALPTRGWPDGALTELLLEEPGLGELSLLWPALARLSQAGREIVLIDPPCVPFAPAWQAAGVVLERLHLLRAQTKCALWAVEQCLRSGACAAVVFWPRQADDRALRRLQVAAESGQCLGFALRPMQAALNPSPAALRIALDRHPRQLRVLKCRGGLAPPQPIALPSIH
jgi:hypothetical protein